MTLKDWLKERGIIFTFWQMWAARAVLTEMYSRREGGTGKTFFMKTLSEFIDEHGNDFKLEELAEQ